MPLAYRILIFMDYKSTFEEAIGENRIEFMVHQTWATYLPKAGGTLRRDHHGICKHG